jgi:hypothetical protein
MLERIETLFYWAALAGAIEQRPFQGFRREPRVRTPQSSGSGAAGRTSIIARISARCAP